MNVELIQSMGDDLTVVNSARVSFDKWHDDFDEDQDARLIRYLAEHKHWTPFAHCQATFRVTAPIFIARQLAKHQVGMVWNEVSRRYVKSDPEFWEPKEWRWAAKDKKQGSGTAADGMQTHCDDIVDPVIDACFQAYTRLLESGICEEQARAVLPLSTMTTWIWTGSLAAWARVCLQRIDAHAQQETRDVASMIAGHCVGLWPVSWPALMRQNA